MRLDRVQAELRPRSPWEALDLGFALAQRFAPKLWAGWAVTAVPVLALFWATLGRWPWLAWLVLWWLRPLFDRVPLFVLSRALFGDAPSPRETLNATPGLLRDGKLAWLTWLRLHPLRAGVLPVTQLEGLRGAAAGRRRGVLASNFATQAGALALICLGFELAMTLALVALVLFFLPSDPSYQADTLFYQVIEGETPGWFSALLAVSWTLAFSAVEPLYVAGGFGLYINRRTEIEGWDVEIAFRRLAARIGGALALLLALAGPALAQDELAHPAEAPAAEAPPAEAPPTDATAAPSEPPSPARAAIDEVLKDPIFPHEETVETWRFKEWLPDGGSSGCSRERPVASGGLGAVAEWLLWGLLAVGLGLLIRALLAAWPDKAGRDGARGEAPATRLGLDVRPESLPPEPGDAALALWGAGRWLEALALLYRASLADLIHHRQMTLDDSDTERDALRRAAPLLSPGGVAYFARLTGAWQQAAYAHRTPDDAAGRELCAGWARHFQVRR